MAAVQQTKKNLHLQKLAQSAQELKTAAEKIKEINVYWRSNQSKMRVEEFKHNESIDIDLRKYFNTIPHKLLGKILQKKVKDRRLLFLT